MLLSDGRYFTFTIVAGEDLDDLTPDSGPMLKAVALDNGRLAENGREAGGILVFGGRIGEHVTLGYSGIMKFAAGEDMHRGALLTVGSRNAVGIREGVKIASGGRGYFFIARRGDYIVGRCLELAVSAGAIGTGAFNFVTPAYCNGDGLNRQSGAQSGEPQGIFTGVTG